MANAGKLYEKPIYLLCEGEGDKRLLDRIIERMRLGIHFTVEFPDRAGDPSGGRSKFGSKLASLLSSSPTFRENVVGVFIVSENDDDIQKSWQEIQKELEISGFPIPNKIGEIATKRGYPKVSVLMLPVGRTGNLETLCLEAAYSKWDYQAHVEAFTKVTPASNWKEGKKAKMQLQSLLAATCMTRPEAGFVGHWRESECYHIPLSHPCFRSIEDPIREFYASVMGVEC